MKKSLVFILFAILGIASVSAQGIRFENESTALEELLQKAKKEGKIVFVDCYTSWCGPCKWMVKNIFPNDTVGNFYNQFICVQIDMEKGKGPEIAKRYNVQCYPTYIFLNGDGKLLHRASSAYPSQEFIEIGEEAINPEKQYSFFKDKYDSGDISRKEFISLMKLSQNSCLSIDSLIEKYFKKFQSDTECASLDWSVIRDFGVDIKSPTFKFLTSNKELFYTVYTEDSVNNVIGNLYLKAMQKCFFYGQKVDTTGYINLRSELINLDISPQSSSIVALADLQFYERLENWKKFANAAVFYIDRYLPKDEQEYVMLNHFAWTFYEHVDGGIYLDLAIGWIKRSVELKQDCFNTDTYAALLYKRGKKAEAEAMALKAIELGKITKTDISATEALLKKIKAMK